MFFQLRSAINVKLVGGMMQSAYLCIFLHVTCKKNTIYRGINRLNLISILGKIQYGDQDGDHC